MRLYALLGFFPGPQQHREHEDQGKGNRKRHSEEMQGGRGREGKKPEGKKRACGG